MNQYEARKAIAQRFMAQWPALSGSIPYYFDDDPFTEVESYAHVSIDFGDDDQRTMGAVGNRRYERPGIIVVELYLPPTVGSKRIDQLVGYLQTMFEGVRIGATGGEEGITTHATQRGRQRSAGQHVTLSVGFDFEYYETR